MVSLGVSCATQTGRIKKMKVKMYILSLVFLFIPIIFYFSGMDDVWAIFIKAYDFCDTSKNSFSCVLWNMTNQVGISYARLIFCIFLICICIYTYRWYKSQLLNLDKGIVSSELIVEGCKRESTEYLSFLSTYIMPLVFTDLTKPSNIFNFTFILVIVGFLHIKTKRIHSNPTLSLFGVSAYSIDYLIRVDGIDSKVSKELVVLSQDDISEGDVIRIINQNDYITFAKYIRKNVDG